MSSQFLKLPQSGIPSVPTYDDLPASGTAGQVYVTDDTGYVYGWSTDSSSWVAGGGSGSVTSVALTAPSSILSVSGSPITESGTIALSLATQDANYIWAGPTSGSAAAPTFRALVSADIPSLNYVTSVGLSDSTGLFNISGSPVTSSGTLSLASLKNQSANTILAGPSSGSAAAPTFRALAVADISSIVAGSVGNNAALVSNGSGGINPSANYVGVPGGSDTVLYDNGSNAAEVVLRGAWHFWGATNVLKWGVSTEDLGAGTNCIEWYDNTLTVVNGINVGGFTTYQGCGTVNNPTPITVSPSSSSDVFTFALDTDNTPNVVSVIVLVAGGDHNTGGYFQFYRQFCFVNPTGSTYSVVSSTGTAIVADIVDGSVFTSTTNLSASVTGSFGASDLTCHVAINNGSSSATLKATAVLWHQDGHLN